MPSKCKAPCESVVSALLAPYACPVPNHEVLTRFLGEHRADRPKRAYQDHGRLGELRAMMAGLEDLVARDIKAESRSQLETTFKHLQELTRLIEAEIHEAVMSCARARRQMQTDDGVPRSALH